jgi:hypothetical protein
MPRMRPWCSVGVEMDGRKSELSDSVSVKIRIWISVSVFVSEMDTKMDISEFVFEIRIQMWISEFEIYPIRIRIRQPGNQILLKF